MKRYQEITTNHIKSSPKKMSHTKKRLIFVAVLAIVALFAFKFYEFGRLSHWWGEREGVRVLKRESISRIKFEDMNIDVVHTKVPPLQHENYKSSSYITKWLSSDSLSQDEIFTNMIAYAESIGWTKKIDSSTETSWRGRKYTPAGSELLLIIKKINAGEEYYAPAYDVDTVVLDLSFR